MAHIVSLIGLCNRVMVSAQWAYAYVTRRRTGRALIGGSAAKPALPSQPPVAKPGKSVMPPSTNKVAPVT